MGRRSSGGSFRATPRVRTPPPQSAKKAPAPAQNNGGGSIIGSIGSAIAEGIGWGTGTGIAHRALDAVVGPRTIRVISESEAPSCPVSPSDDAACAIHNKAFTDCISHNGSDISKCQFYLDMLNRCCRGSDAAIA